ncbi:MAG: glycoside hydrolase family 15 protein [bacterium]|nr:glycoside hydrolase family 15 protein [bacterium]
MARSLALGNGSILVCLDEFARVRDFYFPFVGLENHVGGGLCHRVGIFVGDKISWSDDGTWSISVFCDDKALIGKSRLKNSSLGISIKISDAVYNEKNIFLREFEITNDDDYEKQVKLFLGHEFEMYEAHRGDTAYFEPKENILLHYNGRRIFLINAVTEEGAVFDDWSTGTFGIEGKEGTFKDADEGKLSKNPIEHGPTDSALGLSLTIAAKTSRKVFYWVAVAETMTLARALNDYVKEKGVEYLLKSTGDYWRAWTGKYPFDFYDLPEKVSSLFFKSLLLIRAHFDKGGAIIASGDTDMKQGGKDTYGYVWHRDASFAAMALDRAGDSALTKKFFEFTNDVLSEEGYLMHKYRPDKSLGSSWEAWVRDGKPVLPIQEDETALAILALHKHYHYSRDIEFIEEIYNSFIKKAGNFLADFREKDSGLVKSSYDLWEEKFGSHTFTNCAVYGALKAAADFAGILGKDDSENKFLSVAEEIKDAILKNLYSQELGYFYKSVYWDTDGKMAIDKTADFSSFYGIFFFGILPADDERVVSSFKVFLEKLKLKTAISGIARNENDAYHRKDDNLPGNVWVITSLWEASYHIFSSKKPEDLAPAKDIIEKISSWALESGVLPEQLNPNTGEHISASPLVWSHAAFVLTVFDYLDKLAEFGLCGECNPVK